MADSEQSSKMKEEFEASAKQHFPGWSVVQPNYFQRLPNGDYADEDVEVEWWFWQSAHDAGWLARGKQGEWISVDTPPEFEDHMGTIETDVVLVRNGRGTPIVAWLHKRDGWLVYWGASKIPKPTHWMRIEPLPAAPTETK